MAPGRHCWGLFIDGLRGDGSVRGYLAAWLVVIGVAAVGVIWARAWIPPEP